MIVFLKPTISGYSYLCTYYKTIGSNMGCSGSSATNYSDFTTSGWISELEYSYGDFLHYYSLFNPSKSMIIIKDGFNDILILLIFLNFIRLSIKY
jgi:hypothetical protein